MASSQPHPWVSSNCRKCKHKKNQEASPWGHTPHGWYHSRGWMAWSWGLGWTSLARHHTCLKLHGSPELRKASCGRLWSDRRPGRCVWHKWLLWEPQCGSRYSQTWHWCRCPLPRRSLSCQFWHWVIPGHLEWTGRSPSSPLYRLLETEIKSWLKKYQYASHDWVYKVYKYFDFCNYEYDFSAIVTSKLSTFRIQIMHIFFP